MVTGTDEDPPGRNPIQDGITPDTEVRACPFLMMESYPSGAQTIVLQCGRTSTWVANPKLSFGDRRILSYVLVHGPVRKPAHSVCSAACMEEWFGRMQSMDGASRSGSAYRA